MGYRSHYSSMISRGFGILLKYEKMSKMRMAQTYYERCKVQIDQIADARGLNFNEGLKYVENAMEHLKTGQILTLYCSDVKNKKYLPEWLKKKGYLYLGMVNQSNYYKILLIKD